MGSFKRINNLMVKSSQSLSVQTFIWTDSRGVLCYETDLKAGWSEEVDGLQPHL